MPDPDDTPPQSVRDHLHQAIQATAHDQPDIDGSVLLGWVTIAEWVAPDGNRWLSRISSNATGDREAADWQLQGYLHNALNDWPKTNDEDDDEASDD